MTLGPLGIVAHPTSMSNAIRDKKTLNLRFIILLFLLVWWARRRNNLQPPAGTAFYIRIVALGFPAEVPIIRLFFLLRGRLNISLRLLLVSRCRIVRVRIVWIIRIIGCTPPPWVPPSRTDPDASVEVVSVKISVTVTPSAAVTSVVTMTPATITSSVAAPSAATVTTPATATVTTPSAAAVTSSAARSGC
jgi:hypothetical protein